MKCIKCEKKIDRKRAYIKLYVEGKRDSENYRFCGFGCLNKWLKITLKNIGSDWM